MSSVDCSFKIAGGDVGVLFIHGLRGTPTEVKYTANAVARAGFTVHACQLAGHCGSEDDLRRSGWKDWLQSCLDALDDLRKVCRSVIVVGNCGGAILALRTVIERQPQIAGLVRLFAGILVRWHRVFRAMRRFFCGR